MVASKNSFPWYLCALLLTLALFLVPAGIVSGQESDDALEREAQSIDKMIMCPVCPAETIDQAQVEISFQMRAVIREMLAEGRTREEILDYFVDRYGADILAAPPKSGANLVAWILPIVGVAAGLLGAFFVIRSMTGSQRRTAAPLPASTAPVQAPTPPATADDPELHRYLEIADRILASRRAASVQAIAPGATATASDAPDAGDIGEDSPRQASDSNG